MRSFLFAMFLVVIAIIGCSDGKFNLVLFVPEWEEKERETWVADTSSAEIPSSSSLSATVPSSSSTEIPPLSSSAEAVIPSSSSEELPPSSSSRGVRSSDSRTEKVDSNGVIYEDYPTIEWGAGAVKKGITTRYWDGCKPTCSWPENIGNPNPWAICKSCDRGGINEIPLIYFHPRSDQWGMYYDRVESAWNSEVYHAQPWLSSVTYDTWRALYPSPSGDKSFAYTCYDHVPYAVNDTLAYAFAAFGGETDDGAEVTCGKCYRLQFVADDWRYDPGKPRVTHRALKGKTLIVMSSNTGTVETHQFDLMIPGGGYGAYDCFSEQNGLPRTMGDERDHIFGHRSGGLLAKCVYPTEEQQPDPKAPKPSDRWTLEDWQQCLRNECHRAFDGRARELLDGCLWMADWFMAADNPEVYYSETTCPKYLTDKYNSTLTSELPKRPEGWDKTWQIDGFNYDGR